MRVTEALKLAAADREVYFGDPAFVDVPLDVLLSDDYAARRRAQIDPAKAWPGMPPAGEVGGVSIPPWRPDPSAGAPLEIADTKPETSFLCVADSHGNVFAATPSDPTISGPVVPGHRYHRLDVGVAWLYRGGSSRRASGRAGGRACRPIRRSRSRPGEMVMPFGSPGSEVLGQAMVQVFLNQAVFGMDPQSACEAPRFASYSWPESSLPHSYRPGHLCVEEDVGSATCEALAEMGHRVERWPERKYLAGSVCTIQSDLRTGVKWAGADPRRTAYAIGW